MLTSRVSTVLSRASILPFTVFSRESILPFTAVVRASNLVLTVSLSASILESTDFSKLRTARSTRSETSSRRSVMASYSSSEALLERLRIETRALGR